MKYSSWGLYPTSNPLRVIKPFWRTEIPSFFNYEQFVLPYGYGRSYGDVCLNNGGVLIDCSYLRHFILYDKENGILRCEAGTQLADILKLIVSDGWFLPVTPGTKFISIAGAVANDVHGKNHHHMGSFGRFIRKFELLRSDGERYICSNDENQSLFKATIGGLGLTGLLTWVEISLQRIPGSFLNVESIKFASLNEFFDLNQKSNFYDYTVAWVDFSCGGTGSIRGIFQRANFVESPFYSGKDVKFKFPFFMNFSLINSISVYFFNTLYYSRQTEKFQSKIIHFDPFFYPLDRVLDWNRVYGRKGFLQYQFVINEQNSLEVLMELFNYAKKLGLYSFLTVLKTFGNFEPVGLLSFPRKGITLAMDFPITPNIFKYLEVFDNIVLDAGGVIYPAKDARMSPKSFYSSFGVRIDEFLKWKDPKFSSSFWRRVMSKG